LDKKTNSHEEQNNIDLEESCNASSDSELQTQLNFCIPKNIPFAPRSRRERKIKPREIYSP
jgi:hypothetical protein